MDARTYKYRLYPSGEQKVRIINSLKTCKAIYNELLALSIDAYKFGGVSISSFDFNKYLTGKYPKVHSQSKQNVSDRVHKAFANFFRRVKDPKVHKKGFPRFKSRVNSITFPQSGFKFISNKVSCSKIGNIPVILHRVPKGKIKTLTIKENKIGQWFAIFACELPDVAVKHPSTDKVGIDVGLENFATLSNGEIVANPRYLLKTEKRLNLLQRRLSRKVKGSANRRKAKFRLAKQHLRVANQRSDFLHKLSRKLASRYNIIAVEDLNVKSMLQTHWLAKSITDASWNSFINMLSYKEVALGGQCLKNPRTRGSTHRCSRCGQWVDMPLSERKFSCPKCFNVLHRDLNASINHLNDTVGTDCSKPNACGHNVRPSLRAVVVEAGTTFGNT